VWLAVQRAADRLSWVGVRFTREEGRGGNPRIVCQLDVWLRDIGLVTVRHVDTNAYVGVDCAAVRVEQAVVRKLREHGAYSPTRRPRGATAIEADRRTSSKYALVILPSDARPRLSLIPWFRTRYGIEEVQTLSLTWPEWDALVAGETGSPHLKRFTDCLALAQLTRPEAIVVVGSAVPRPSVDEQPRARREVERVATTIQALGLPTEVIRVWVNECWRAEDCLIESEELPLSAERTSSVDSDEELYAGLTSD
jgi:hypothetical protein